ncbi:MAG: 30S ribosomal protein S18 [Anaerolineales bacterium]|nr:30S ribosomal protein S18 [Anaerolineales bacterium]
MQRRRQNRGGNRRRICAFCVDKVKVIDYKDHEMLGRYVNEFGRIRPRRQTGTCAKHQRALAVSVKRARHIALLPFVND